MTIVQILLILFIISLGNLLERLNRENPKFFNGLILLLALVFTSQDVDSIISFRGGDSSENIVLIEFSPGKRKKINIVTHRRLEIFFPDWEERIAYQKNREKVYQAAMRKRREVLRLGQKEDFDRTKDEQDAIDYFSGSGFYQIHQDPRVEPNIFDNRQSFLLKVHNKKMRMKFLKSFNRRNNQISKNS